MTVGEAFELDTETDTVMTDTCRKCSRLLEDHTLYLEHSVWRVFAEDICFMALETPTKWYGKPWSAPPPDQKCDEDFMKVISS